jgi:proteasome lid subunit RPN8/RPN11
MDGIINKLYLRRSHWQLMQADIQERNLEEACGLIAGVDQTSLAVYPITNILHSPVRYRMDPEQQLEYFNQIDENQWELLAIYHSHLHGPPGPSQIDIAEATYPGVIYLIWSPMRGEWDCQGYLIENGQVDQVPIYLIDGETNGLIE